MIGIQVNTLHELESLIKVTDILQIEVLQLFLKIPFEFSRKNFFHIQSIFSTLKKTYSIQKIYIHAPDHLILNGNTRKIRLLQWKRLKEMLNQSNYLGADGVIAHLQFKTSFPVENLAEEAESVFWDHPPDIPIIFENVIFPDTYGGSLLLMKQFLEKLHEFMHCEICLDTAHLHQTGYSFRDKEEAVALKQAHLWLFQHVSVLHINDSKAPPNSRVDWHEHLGKGTIGLGSLGAIISLFNKNQSFIIETPKKRFEDFIENTNILRNLLSGNIKKGDSGIEN